jgi:lysozyme
MSKPLNVVIDISHHDGNVNLAKAKEDGILGVIQKATQGQTFKDPTYQRNRQKAKDAGLLWGAYHFGTGSDGLKQAQHCLDTVGNNPRTLLALDFEPNPTGPSMDLVTHINGETGRFPGFYSGHYIKQLLGTSTDPILAECWFWLAPGRGIASGASGRLAIATCCCSLMGRTNRLVALSSRPDSSSSALT